MVKIEKDGVVQEVKERFLWKFLEQGWKQSSPKVVTGKATVKPVQAKVEDILPEVETDSNQSFDANIKGD